MGQRKRMGRGLGRMVALILLLVLAVLALPWLVPGGPLQRLTAARLAAILGRPVDLQGVSLHLLPVPGLHAASLRIGEGDAVLVQAEDLDLRLDPAGWLLEHPFRQLSARRAAFQPALLLAALSEPGPPGRPGLPLLDVAQVQLYPAGAEDSGIALHLVALPQERWQAELSRGGDTLTLHTERAGKTLLLTLAASRWGAAGGPLLTQLTGLGRVADGGLELERLTASLGSGQLRMALHLERTQTWHAKGALTLEQLPLGPLLAWAGLPLLTGSGSGTLYLNGEAADLTELTHTATLSGHLDLGAGTLLGLDLATPVERLTVGEYAGGDTPFEGLQLAVERPAAGEWLVTLEALQAAGLSGRGLLRVSGGVLLDGAIDVRLGGIGSRSVPLLIAGTALAPRVRVAPEALLAAAPLPASVAPAPPVVPEVRPMGGPTPAPPEVVPATATALPPVAQPAPVTEIPLPDRRPERPAGWLGPMSRWWGGDGRKPLVDRPSAPPKGPQKDDTRPWILDYQ